MLIMVHWVQEREKLYLNVVVVCFISEVTNKPSSLFPIIWIIVQVPFRARIMTEYALSLWDSINKEIFLLKKTGNILSLSLLQAHTWIAMTSQDATDLSTTGIKSQIQTWAKFKPYENTLWPSKSSSMNGVFFTVRRLSLLSKNFQSSFHRLLYVVLQVPHSRHVENLGMRRQ